MGGASDRDMVDDVNPEISTPVFEKSIGEEDINAKSALDIR